MCSQPEKQNTSNETAKSQSSKAKEDDPGTDASHHSQREAQGGNRKPSPSTSAPYGPEQPEVNPVVGSKSKQAASFELKLRRSHVTTGLAMNDVLIASLIPDPFSSAPITLLVGGHASPSSETEPVPFYIHVDLLTRISPFFRAAFGDHTDDHKHNRNGPFLMKSRDISSFQEFETGTMHLPEERPEDIRYLIQWIYWTATQLSVFGTIHISTYDNTSNGLHHFEAIETPLKKYKTWLSEKQNLKKAKLHGGDISELLGPRPAPPSFGPLLRLYLLADKYGIRGGLTDEICHRVRQVGSLGNVVPGRRDVTMVWDGICTCGGSGVGDESLKKVLLEMYAEMNERSLSCLLFGDHDEDLEDGDDGEWHTGFLRELVLELFSKSRSGKTETKYSKPRTVIHA